MHQSKLAIARVPVLWRAHSKKNVSLKYCHMVALKPTDIPLLEGLLEASFWSCDSSSVFTDFTVALILFLKTRHFSPPFKCFQNCPAICQTFLTRIPRDSGIKYRNLYLKQVTQMIQRTFKVLLVCFDLHQLLPFLNTQSICNLRSTHEHWILTSLFWHGASHFAFIFLTPSSQ